MAQVLLTDVTKVYPGDVKAVDRFNLDIHDGEFIVLVGPSGCGKSTTLRMVAGLEEITSGEIRIGERIVNDVHPKDRDIAMVFQNYALYPHMTVYNNMAFGLKLRKMPRKDIDQRVRNTAKILGIEMLLERKPKALSGGQRQRVALGRAIVREPKAFLFDEPLSNLDAKLRVETRAELKALHMRLGTTTIYVTHDQEEAMTLGDRVVVMSNGLIQHVGTPIEVYNRPANRFVAGFLGMPPMNFLNGTVEAGSGPGGANQLQFVEFPPPAGDNGKASGTGAIARAAGVSTGAAEGGRGLVIPVPERFRRAAEAWIGRDLVFGIRPEGITAAHTAAHEGRAEYAGSHGGSTPGAVRGYAEGSSAADVPMTAAALGSREPAHSGSGVGRSGDDGATGRGRIALDVLVVEPLGDRMDVHLTSPLGRRMVARMPVTELKSGTRAEFTVDPRSIHLFEPGEFGPRFAEA